MEQKDVSGFPISPKATEKSGKGMKIATAVSVVAAICGIGFGVYGMTQSNNNTKSSNLDLQLKDAEGNSIVSVGGDENGGTVTMSNPIEKKENPIAAKTISGVAYSVNFNIPFDDSRLNLYVNNGKVESCSIYNKTTSNSRNCSVNGLDGEIYKVAIIGEGQAISDNTKIGFIMGDGTVKYAPLIESFKKSAINIKGTAKIDGFVTDVFDVNVTEQNGGGYASTVFTLSDGKTVEYDKSMF
jgi:hypothetical protein